MNRDNSYMWLSFPQKYCTKRKIGQEVSGWIDARTPFDLGDLEYGKC